MPSTSRHRRAWRHRWKWHGSAKPHRKETKNLSYRAAPLPTAPRAATLSAHPPPPPPSCSCSPSALSSVLPPPPPTQGMLGRRRLYQTPAPGQRGPPPPPAQPAAHQRCKSADSPGRHGCHRCVSATGPVTHPGGGRWVDAGHVPPNPSQQQRSAHTGEGPGCSCNTLPPPPAEKRGGRLPSKLLGRRPAAHAGTRPRPLNSPFTRTLPSRACPHRRCEPGLQGTPCCGRWPAHTTHEHFRSRPAGGKGGGAAG